MKNLQKWIFLGLFLSLGLSPVSAMTLDENCSVNILNRTVQVSSNGAWAMPNVPSLCVLEGLNVNQTGDFNDSPDEPGARAAAIGTMVRCTGMRTVPDFNEATENCNNSRDQCYDDEC